MATDGYRGSPIQHAVAIERDIAIRMRDGVTLCADLYRPAQEGRPLDGRFPIIMERTPYNKASVQSYEIGAYFAKRGYVCLIQDVRGRYRSGGEWYHLLNSPDEGADGYDTCAWIVDQPWCDGRIGTIGVSFTGANQQALAIMHPPGLSAQFIIDSGYNYFHRTIRHSGAFGLGVQMPYLFHMARESRDALANRRIAQTLDEACRDLVSYLQRWPLRRGATPLALAPTYERLCWDLITQSNYSDFWKNPGANLEEHIDRYPDIPVFLVTSWYGHNTWATVTKYRELTKRLSSPVRLLVGMWLHGWPELSQSWAGDADFGQEAAWENPNDLRLKWFDHFLKGLPTDVLAGPPIRLFVMGGGTGRRTAQGRLEHGGVWRFEHEWPLARTVWTRYFMHRDGTLSELAPELHAAPSTYTFDPLDPVPTVGGNVMDPGTPGIIQGGAFDQRGRRDLAFCKDTLPLGLRSDVLVFQTPPLADDVEVTGPIAVHLHASSSAPDTDFTAKLIDVHPPSDEYPEGFAMNLCDSIVRARYRKSREHPEFLEPGRAYEFVIEPQPTSNRFRKGHRIRVDISSSSFPQFDVNPNTGEPLGESRQVRVAHQTVYHDAAHPSHLVLPIIPAAHTHATKRNEK
jgi:putative CocE/NonD family hydrolase